MNSEDIVGALRALNDTLTDIRMVLQSQHGKPAPAPAESAPEEAARPAENVSAIETPAAPTKDDVIAALKELKKVGGNVPGLLDLYGAKNVSQLQEKDYEHIIRTALDNRDNVLDDRSAA